MFKRYEYVRRSLIIYSYIVSWLAATINSLKSVAKLTCRRKVKKKKISQFSLFFIYSFIHGHIC